LLSRRFERLRVVEVDPNPLGHTVPLDEFAQMFEQAATHHAGLSTFGAAMTLLWCELGRPADARALLAPAVASGFSDLPEDNLWLTSTAAYADAIALLGDAQAAAPPYELLLPYEDRLAVNRVNLCATRRPTATSRSRPRSTSASAPRSSSLGRGWPGPRRSSHRAAPSRGCAHGGC
jgi:hypothetical protein